MHDPSKCAFKNWLAAPPPPPPTPPQKKNVCKNKNTKRKLRLLSVLTSLHHYRVSQKFVPLISCTMTLDQNFIFT